MKRQRSNPELLNPGRTSLLARFPVLVLLPLPARLPLLLVLLAAFFAALLAPASASTLENRLSLDSFNDEDARTAEEISTYPSSARHAALIAAGHPEALLEIQRIQKESASDFAALLAPYPRETQERIWNLVRYPDLARAIAGGGRKSTRELEAIAAKYPSEDRAAIVEEGRERYDVWVQIYALDLDVEQSFFALLSDLPPDARSAFDELTDHPGLTSLLIDNMHVTTTLGALYREDPAAVEDHFNALHDEVLARRAEEERAWSAELADPESAEELEQAARAFADEYGYDYEEVRSAPSTTIHVTHYVDVLPYPYWFGYPVWYHYDYWYPRPIWGHIGFRFSSGGTHGFISVGLPSLFFLDWYHRSYAPIHHVVHTSPYRYRSGGYRSRGYRSGDRPQHRPVRYYETHRPHRVERYRRHHDDGRRPARLGSRASVERSSPALRRAADGRRLRGSRDRQVDRNPRRPDAGLRRAERGGDSGRREPRRFDRERSKKTIQKETRRDSASSGVDRRSGGVSRERNPARIDRMRRQDAKSGSLERPPRKRNERRAAPRPEKLERPRPRPVAAKPSAIRAGETRREKTRPKNDARRPSRGEARANTRKQAPKHRSARKSSIGGGGGGAAKNRGHGRKSRAAGPRNAGQGRQGGGGNKPRR